VVRASLGVALVVGPGGLGCLVIDSPDFSAADAAGPYLRSISPTTYQLHVEDLVEAAGEHRLTFEVLSEDLNQPQQLQSAVVLDFPGFGVPYADQLEHRLAQAPIRQGHLPTPRQVDVTFNSLAIYALGCHSVTLIVSHEFDSNSLTIKPAHEGDVATLTWWYVLIEKPSDIPDISGCYARQPANEDAGADAQERLAR
jgi:hypothetical protein